MFEILKLPKDLLIFILRFVNPNRLHRLYRVCKRFNQIVSDRKFLLNKLEYDLKIEKSELEPLFDLNSKLRTLTPYLRYVRTLAFYDRVIRSSEAWLEENQCIKLGVKSKDIEVLKYFNSERAEELLGVTYNKCNLYKCIKAHIRGKTVKCDTQFNFKHFEDTLIQAEKIYRGDSSDLKAGSSISLIKFAFKIGKFNIAFKLAEKCEATEYLENLLLNKFIADGNLEGCKQLHDPLDCVIRSKLLKNNNYEFIMEYLKQFPKVRIILSKEIWSHAFTRAFTEHISEFLTNPFEYFPYWVLVKHKNSFINNSKIKYGDILLRDILMTVYNKKIKTRRLKCPCGKIPLKAMLCSCSGIISCNFCDFKTRSGSCKYCNMELCRECAENYKCICEREIICNNCIKYYCNSCGGSSCKKCNVKECKDCGEWLCKLCMRQHKHE